jgi:hypothetical protein
MPDFGFHNWLDAQLRNVPLPPGMLARLSANGPEPADEDLRLDNLLRDVPVPIDLESRLRRIARPAYLPMPTWRRVAMAASVLVMVSLGAAGYVALIGPTAPQVPSLAAKADTPEHPISQPGLRDRGITATDVGRVASAEPAPVAATEPPTIKQAGVATPANLPTYRELYDQMAKVGTTVRQAIETKARTQAALGAAGALDRRPDFDVIDTLVPRRGVSPPRVGGYDLLFQLKHNEHPFVSPAAHADLAASQMPFTLGTATYDLARRAVRAGGAPALDEIRVEDFLAAQNYLLPAAPPGGLALHLAGCSSPLVSKAGIKNVYLVELAVQAAARQRRPHAASRLVVAVEMSWPMRTGGRWEATERALRKIAESMTAADRLTLIDFREHSRVLAADATSREIQALLTSGKLQPPSGSADFAAAIEAAGEAARAPSGGLPSRITFITAGHKNWDEISPAQVKRQLADTAGEATPWQIVCVARDGVDEGQQGWVQAAGGKITLADSSAGVHGVLLESLNGRPSTVAAGVSLKVTFNPRSVAAYRLLGHEAVTLTGPATDPVTIDLAAEQAAVGLYELQLKPKGDEVAVVAELKWTDPATGQARRVVRAIRRGQLTASFSQAPAWLQQGVVAAKAAEVLRGSFYSPSDPLSAVLELAEHVDPRVPAQPDFQDLLTLVQQAEKARK